MKFSKFNIKNNILSCLHESLASLAVEFQVRAEQQKYVDDLYKLTLSSSMACNSLKLKKF